MNGKRLQKGKAMYLSQAREGLRQFYFLTPPWGKSLINLFVHILRMAGIDHSYHVTLNGVSIVPFVGVRHVVAFPSADGRATAR